LASTPLPSIDHGAWIDHTGIPVTALLEDGDFYENVGMAILQGLGEALPGLQVRREQDGKPAHVGVEDKS
jgi:hypothetical protein